jgi:hypothetical protein
MRIAAGRTLLDSASSEGGAREKSNTKKGGHIEVHILLFIYETTRLNSTLLYI